MPRGGFGATGSRSGTASGHSTWGDARHHDVSERCAPLNATGCPSGHAPPLREQRLNHGAQQLPSGAGSFAAAPDSPHYRSISQRLPELRGDFTHDEQRASCSGFHHGSQGSQNRAYSTGPLQKSMGSVEHRRQCVFVGFVEVDMDGRAHTAGEMDRMMAHAAACKYPCSRPATLDEYAGGLILGLPARNSSGRDLIFIGADATGRELPHTNTLGAQKCVVPPGDPLDGTTGAASLYGRKCCLCIYPVERVRRQQSLSQFGLARGTMNAGSGRLRRSGSFVAMRDSTEWTRGNHLGSSHQSQRMIRTDDFFT